MRVELKASGGHYYKHTAIINCDSGVILGSGCATVDRVVALDIRGPGFKSSHSKSLSNNYYTIYFSEKSQIKKKRTRMAHLSLK